MKRIKAITNSFFRGSWVNSPFLLLPVFWLFSPLCILIGYFLPDFMVGIKHSEYKGTKDDN